jgi:hypothetical protein
MRKLIVTLSMVATFLFFYGTTAEARVDKPVPEHLISCVSGAVGELATIDGSEASVRKLFVKYVDRDALGRATYGIHWKNADKRWRDAAIELYFSLLYTKGTKAKGSASVVDIKHRLADNPDRGGDGSKGYWHIAFSATLSNGSIISAAVLLSDNCKVLDLSPGVWLSSQVSASEVDLALRQKQ